VLQVFEGFFHALFRAGFYLFDSIHLGSFN
jgi:hypothetical protein